jgi:hypothetical protein
MPSALPLLLPAWGFGKITFLETIQLAGDAVLEFLEHDLKVSRLNRMHQYLWLAGRPMPPRPLHQQKMLSRQVIITEKADLHLVWSAAGIFVKPLPRYLLNSQFWQDYLIPHSNELYGLALGFLLSYTTLILYESDFEIAKEARLLPLEVTWPQWITLTRQLKDRCSFRLINKRYFFGELRLTRLNAISQYKTFSIAPYYFDPNQSSIFRRYFGFWAATFGYIIVVLTAMQVGLATSRLYENSSFQRAAFGFTVFSIFSPLITVGIVVVLIALVYSSLFLYNVYVLLLFKFKRDRIGDRIADRTVATV